MSADERVEGGRTGTSKGSGALRPGRFTAWQRRLILLAFSLVFSLVVLGLLEGGLRLAGYGGYGSTFFKAGTLPDGSSLIFTDHAGPTSYFFANRSRGGSLDRDAFVMPKPEGTFRVFIVGGSAAKGNPYTHPLTGGSFLREMLADLWPDRDVEVINLGTTAVASFPALGLMTEALRYEPDLIVAYTGNNEFYGAYGVTSLHSAGRSPFMIRLIRATRSTAIAQFLDGVLRAPAKPDSDTLMETMVGQSYVGPDDPARAAAARNLNVFVGAMVDRCEARGVPIVVCTPPCNERGLAPLGGEGLQGVPAADRDRMASLLASARELAASDPTAARATVEEALALGPRNATAHYLLARSLEAQGLAAEAAPEYREAVSLDPMPWRPPGPSVDAVRRAAESRGAILCDLAEMFRRESEGGAVGWDLMDDHVHASLRGQDLVARSIVRTLASEGAGPLEIDGEAVEALPDWLVYADRLGWNRYDLYAAAYVMRELGAISFYRESNPQFYDRFNDICVRVEAEASPGVRQAILAWQDPDTHKGDYRPLTAMVARALFGEGEYAEAARLFDVASRSVTPYGSWELQYVYGMLLCHQQLNGRLDEEDLEIAGRYAARGEALVSFGPSRTGAAERFTGELLLMRGEAARAIGYLESASSRLTGLDRLGSDMSLARALVAVGRGDEAMTLAESRVAEGGDLTAYYAQLLAQLGGAAGAR